MTLIFFFSCVIPANSFIINRVMKTQVLRLSFFSKSAYLLISLLKMIIFHDIMLNIQAVFYKLKTHCKLGDAQLLQVLAKQLKKIQLFTTFFHIFPHIFRWIKISFKQPSVNFNHKQLNPTIGLYECGGVFLLSVVVVLQSGCMDIDSSSFDAKRYVLSMLKQNSIKQLMRRNNEIDEEIKIHDHEIQSLVFQNYSKFISSIDTVRQMKDNICQVDDKLKVLETSMDNISRLALKIDSTFAVKRKEIQKLDTINKDLEKLKNLCEFPNVLAQDIKHYKSVVESNRLQTEADQCFARSIQFYEQCYATLLDLKEEPLIAPIYREAVDKVETIRSTLKAAQAQFNKNKSHSAVLRSITRKLLIITDDQVSVLRIYFHSWKERFGEACFRSERRPHTLPTGENGRRVLEASTEIPEINEDLWKEFEAEFKFIYEEAYPKLRLTAEEAQIYITAHAREIFGWALGHYSEAAPLHCGSLKSFVHVHHMLDRALSGALERMGKAGREGEERAAEELKEKMNERFEQLGNHMLNFIFGRMKLHFLLEVGSSKSGAALIKISEETLKQAYIRLLNPLKENVTLNFKAFLDDMEYFRNNSTVIFKQKDRYEEAIHKQIESFLRFLATAVSTSSEAVSEQLCLQSNPLYSSKELHKSEKQLIEGTVREFKESGQSGCWFIVAFHFLSSLQNNLAKKVIENTQKNVEIPKNHNYAQLFTFIKGCTSRSLVAFADHFAFGLRHRPTFELMLPILQDFVDVLNIIFIQTKRNIMKKPSFLKDCASVHETEVLAVKKLHLLEKKLPADRSAVLLYFIRKVLKELLLSLRKKIASGQPVPFGQLDLYCIVQLCYEMINVEEESQIVAFYTLINQNFTGERLPQEQVDEKYTQLRKLIRDNLTK